MNWIIPALCLLAIFATTALAEAPSKSEMSAADKLNAALVGVEPDTQPPFSFVIGGKPFNDVRNSWKHTRSTKKLGESRAQTTITWKDPVTGLTVRCVAVRYADYPMVEWTVYLHNDGKTDTPIIEGVQALDHSFTRAATGEFVLHHNAGSTTTPTDYRPLEAALGPGASAKLGSPDGWPTGTDLSYMNLDWGGIGMIIAVGWPGQWSATFQRDTGVECRVVAGQGHTHFVLHPGEEFRTPLIVLQPWEGDLDHAQNVWRRWMMAHNLPKPGGKPIKPMLLATGSRVFEEMTKATEDNQKLFIDRYLEEGLKIDYWWMDAGWYPNMGRWGDVGTWEVDRKRFPNGLRAISDHAHAKGVKTLVWFEPERVAPKTWLAENKQEWILKSPTFDETWGRLFNLGNPDAWKWLLERIDGLINSEGIDLYRQDFNIPPLSFWEAADAADRQGITENQYVTGHLALWDELRKRHPNMIIDDCASGGRRLDIESLRRSVPLWRSDYAYEPVGCQGITYGISSWIPYHGTGTTACGNVSYYSSGKTPVEPYAFWSNVAPSTVCTFDMQVPDLDYAAIRKLVASWREVSADYAGDFYPLSAYSAADDQWMAWQFNRSEAGSGFVQAFRRAHSPYTSAVFALKGLEPDAKYSVWSVDAPEKASTSTGKDLMGSGLPISLSQRLSAAVMAYRRTGGK